MILKKKACIVSLLLVASSLLTNCYSQAKSSIGLNLLFDKTANSNFRTGYGISIDIKVAKRFSIGLENNYRTYIDNSFVDKIPLPPNNIGLVYFTMKQKFLTIPLLLNYHSKIVDLSFGPTVDIYLGIHEEKYRTNPQNLFVPTFTSYKFDNLTLWGLKFKLSKDFKLVNNIGVEPGIFYNPVLTRYSLYTGHYTSNRQYYGASITIKYHF